MKLKYNKVVEFVTAFYTWTSWQQFESLGKINEIPQEIIDWKESLDGNFSEYFYEQSKFIASDFLILIFSLLKIVIFDELENIEDFLKRLESYDEKEFVKIVVYGESLSYTANQLMKNPSLGKEALLKSSGTVKPNEGERFVDFLKHPQFYIDQLVYHLSEFYEKGIKPFQSSVEKKMKTLLEEENIELKKDMHSFLESRLHLKNDELSEVLIPENIFITYYDCLDSVILTKPSITIYGWKSRNIGSNAGIEEILSLLTDESRRNILKGLAKRPMFNREIAEIYNLSPSTVSHHISKLYSFGLLNFRTGDRKRIYHELNKEKLESIIDLIKIDLLGN